MDLLPKNHKDFSSKDYWNDFFSCQKSQHFEWYGEYESLCNILDKYIYTKDKMLIIGCGNSKLSADLYDVGFCNSTSIDISATVIQQMKHKYGEDRPNMIFEKMDVFEMTYENETFAVAIDKGTLDALMVDESIETNHKIDKLFSEIARVLRYCGRYICISLLQEHILNKLLDWFLDKGWLVRIHRCTKAEAKHEGSISFPVFLVVLTKMKKIDGAPMVLEIAYNGMHTPTRCSSKQDVIDYVKSAQHYAFLKHFLNKKKVVDDDICLELYAADTGVVKYRMYVVDREEVSSMKFAVFIVPQGREIEWLFSTPEGRQELAKSANCERLIVVHLLRNIVYNSLDEVKKDLSEKVLELAPVSCKSKMPILTLGDDVGKREIKCSGNSAISGDYVVEDVVLNNDDVYRRLIFLSNPYLVQSEAKLTTEQRRKKKRTSKLEINFDYLACDHHVAIIAGLAFLGSQMLSPKILLIGLGGGTLAMYLYKHFPDADIEVVELDSAIVEVAKKWFSLVTDKRLKINVNDGVVFIQEAAKKGSLYNLVILDVDSKNPALGISSPPLEFLDPALLNILSDIIDYSGAVVMNLACRNAALHSETCGKLKSAFKTIFSRKIPAEVNEVIYCLKSQKSDDVMNSVKKCYSELTSYLKKQTKNSDVFDASELITCLNEIT